MNEYDRTMTQIEIIAPIVQHQLTVYEMVDIKVQTTLNSIIFDLIVDFLNDNATLPVSSPIWCMCGIHKIVFCFFFRCDFGAIANDVAASVQSVRL